MTIEGEMRKLERELERRFRVVETSVDIGDRTVNILHPASAEELISEADFERDERLPYWAELWPSARVLAERVMGLMGGGRGFLELGCGAGLVTTCAAIAGFEAIASDYYDDAVAFARVNAWRNTGHVVSGVMLDWRDFVPDAKRYDVVAASDVLYERGYGDVVAGVIAGVLGDDGVAIVADPGRSGREAFLAALAPAGLRLVSSTNVPFVDGVVRQTITMFEIARSKERGE